MAVKNWVYGVSNVNDARTIKVMGAESESEALHDSYYASGLCDYVSRVYKRCPKAELIKLIERDGWKYFFGNNVEVECKVKPVPHVKKTQKDVPIIKRELDL